MFDVWRKWRSQQQEILHILSQESMAMRTGTFTLQCFMLYDIFITDTHTIYCLHVYTHFVSKWNVQNIFRCIARMIIRLRLSEILTTKEHTKKIELVCHETSVKIKKEMHSSPPKKRKTVTQVSIIRNSTGQKQHQSITQ